MTGGRVFNPPPGWPAPPPGWVPPAGWSPDPSWPALPEEWDLWISADPEVSLSDDSSVDRVEAVLVDDMVVERGGEAGLARRVEILEAENAALRRDLESVQRTGTVMVDFDDDRVLQEVGVYRYHHPLEDAAAFQDRLRSIDMRISEMVTSGHAIEKPGQFTFDGSLAKGQRMVEGLSKLMLRAYNAESDNSIRSLRAGNVEAAKRRLEASRSAIARFSGAMQMRISDSFHALRLEEIELTADWLMIRQEEKEAAREERARLREERKVEAELAEERKRLDKERSHLVSALEALRAIGSGDPDLLARLQDVDRAIEKNDFRAANIRAGYVYVISNRGAFGEGVVKIGLTRRLEPTERISELSGASVPFRFDTHALFFSEDAVTLERELHEHFASRALNQSNPRKEFFFAAPAEVRDVLLDKVGNILEFREDAEAQEYLQSVRSWPVPPIGPR